MKIRQEDAELTARWSPEYKEFDSKHRPELEKKKEEAERDVLEKKAKFDEGRFLQKENRWELFTELEIALIKKTQLTQNLNDEKEKIGQKIRKINIPYIETFVEDLMRETMRLNGRKEFEVLEDRVGAEGDTTFRVNYNHPHVNEVQKILLDACEQIRGMECEPLLDIKAVFDGAIENIPETFRFEEQEGGQEFKTWVFDSKPSGMNADFERLWLWEAKIKADHNRQEQILSYWKPIRKPDKDREVQKLVDKHILTVELGHLMDKARK